MVDLNCITRIYIKAKNISKLLTPNCIWFCYYKFGLKIHFHKKHSSAKFKCFTCDFTCENYSDLDEHNNKYYYSHRVILNKYHEKYILDEFQKLDQDGFLIHRTLDWSTTFSFVRYVFRKYPSIRLFVFWINPCSKLLLKLNKY